MPTIYKKPELPTYVGFSVSGDMAAEGCFFCTCHYSHINNICALNLGRKFLVAPQMQQLRAAPKK